MIFLGADWTLPIKRWVTEASVAGKWHIYSIKNPWAPGRLNYPPVVEWPISKETHQQHKKGFLAIWGTHYWRQDQTYQLLHCNHKAVESWTPELAECDNFIHNKDFEIASKITAQRCPRGSLEWKYSLGMAKNLTLNPFFPFSFPFCEVGNSPTRGVECSRYKVNPQR